MPSNNRIILIAGMGTSPAVLTETVWALAHQKKPVVPDEIVVLTTKSGKDALREAVMAGVPCVWERFKMSLRKEKIAIEGKLVFGDTSIRVIPDEDGNEAGDLRTGADNLRAADFMLGELRKYTEDTETTILCSIAGGRKTMSALLFSCMTLLGREQDKVYHVLLPPEFEQGVEPPFFFPEPGKIYTAKATGKKYRANKVQSELFEVPFVRMRGWYQEKFKNIPPSYRTLISKVQTVAPPAVAYPEIEIDAWNGGGGDAQRSASRHEPSMLCRARFSRERMQAKEASLAPLRAPCAARRCGMRLARHIQGRNSFLQSRFRRRSLKDALEHSQELYGRRIREC